MRTASITQGTECGVYRRGAEGGEAYRNTPLPQETSLLNIILRERALRLVSFSARRHAQRRAAHSIGRVRRPLIQDHLRPSPGCVAVPRLLDRPAVCGTTRAGLAWYRP
jgi:hypothetical protein